MSIEITLFFGLIACIIGVAGFFGGKQASAKHEGQTWGAFTSEIKTDISYIKRDVGDIKVSVEKHNGDAMKAISDEGRDRRNSIRRLHSKIDDHLRRHHSINIPANDDFSDDLEG